MNGAQQGQAQGGHVQGQGNAQGYRPQNGGQNGAPNGSMSNGGGGRGPHGNGSAGGGGAHRYKPFNVTKYKPEAWQPSLRQPVPYTDEEYERILTLLDKVLGPEYVSFRPGGGGQSVSYIEGWRALNLANEIFGFNGWLLELISSQVDYFDTQHGTGRISMGLSVVVRITIRDGTYHEDFGYGYIENSKNKAMAFEKCKKEAFTDGLKRCLRCFGNVLGNCLYDRSLIPKLRKVKLPPAELEAENFHRDPLLRRKTAQQQQQAQQVQQAPQEAHTVGIPSVSMSASASSGSGSGSGLSLGSGSGSGSTNSSGTPLTSVLINPVPLAPSLGTSNSGV